MTAPAPVARLTQTGELVLLVDPDAHREAFHVYIDARGRWHFGEPVTPVHILDDPAEAPSVAGPSSPLDDPSVSLPRVAGSSSNTGGPPALSGASGPSKPPCRHHDSLYGRCMACGMTWEAQTRERVERDAVVETVERYTEAQTVMRDA